jgi:hypothetical protein
MAIVFLAIVMSRASAGVDLGPGAIVSTVRDAQQRPVAGALVVADGPTTRQAFTGSAGVVTLLGLPLGKYVVRVIRSGYAPVSTTVAVGRNAQSIRVVPLSITPATFANLNGASTQPAPAGLDAGNDPYVAAALTTALAADVVPAYLDRGVAATLEGTQPGETRIELDGIPIAGGAGGVAALRFRNALQLDRIDLVEGPALPSTSVAGAIGGVINYRTAPIATSLDAGLTVGFDSAFGSFARPYFSNTYGKFGILADLFEGQSGNHGQVLKAQVALSPSTTLLASAYGLQSVVSGAASEVTNEAPAYALDLRTMLGAGTLQGRLFESASDTTQTTIDAASQSEDWRIAGLQLGFGLPFGENVMRIGFERHSERAAFDPGTLATETLSTLRLGTDLQLSRTSRFEIADAIDSGTLLSRRNDPQLALAIRPNSNLTLRVAAGSAYATSLDVLAAAAASAGVPETSFGYRASADESLGTGDHLHAALFSLRRFDAFASLADARSSGLELGFEHPALPGGLGVVAGVDLARTYAFGAEQPAPRFSGLPLLDGAQLADDPFTKARLAIAYRRHGSEFDFGSTLLGANNGLANHAVVLGDVSLRLQLAAFADVRLGLENLFGQTIADPVLAPLYPPREFTLAVGRFGG